MKRSDIVVLPTFGGPMRIVVFVVDDVPDDSYETTTIFADGFVARSPDDWVSRSVSSVYGMTCSINHNRFS